MTSAYRGAYFPRKDKPKDNGRASERARSNLRVFRAEVEKTHKVTIFIVELAIDDGKSK